MMVIGSSCSDISVWRQWVALTRGPSSPIVDGGISSSGSSAPSTDVARKCRHVQGLGIASLRMPAAVGQLLVVPTLVGLRKAQRLRWGRNSMRLAREQEPGKHRSGHRVSRRACSTFDFLEPPPAIIIGAGRMGDALYCMGVGQDIVLRRGDPFPADAPEGPVYVCTRPADLGEAVALVPKERHEDLVFVQNAALLPFIDREFAQGLPVTVLLAYFTVHEIGDEPVDVKTHTDPGGLTVVGASGKWAEEVEWRLQTCDGERIACRRLPEPSFTQAYWERNLWTAAYMLVGALHGGCTVGEVELRHRQEVDSLIAELATAVTAVFPDVVWDRGQVCERLAAYARSVADLPAVIEEFDWRNGTFYDLTLRAESAGRKDPCPSHTAALIKLRVIEPLGGGVGA